MNCLLHCSPAHAGAWLPSKHANTQPGLLTTRRFSFTIEEVIPDDINFFRQLSAQRGGYAVNKSATISFLIIKPIDGRPPPHRIKPDNIETGDDNSYPIKCVIYHVPMTAKNHNEVEEYRIHWDGYSLAHCTWMAADSTPPLCVDSYWSKVE